MNKKLYKFISIEEYERIVKIREFYTKRNMEAPAKYKCVYKKTEDGRYYRPKNLEYEQIVQILIREKYSDHDEFAIQRKRYTELDKFQEYYDYVESCISQAKEFINERNNWDNI